MKKAFIVALIGFVAAFSTVRGDIIPSFAGTSPGTGTNTVWNYTINITSDQQVTTGDFFTIYDFGPFVMGSNLQPTGWSFSSALVTAPPTGTNPPDNPTLENLTWTYTGTATIPTGTHLGNFSVAVATPQFKVPVPVPIPEPTTLSLLALAGVGSALRAIRRRR